MSVDRKYEGQSLDILCLQYGQLADRVRELEEALEVYADRENWLDDTDGRLPIVEVGPGPAQRALKGKKEN